MSAKLQGIYTPNIVPYDEKGRINEEELRRIIHWLGEKGVTGFYPNGSMGEFIRLSYEERKQVVRIVCEESGGRPVLAGAAEPNIDLVLEMCGYCADLGCQAVSITGPYYYKLSQESIEQYFRDIAERSPIDIVIYNIPVFANEISIPVLKRLALDCPRIVGTKDTSRDMPRFQNLIHEIKPQRPDFSMLIGWEELLCAAMFMGADGGTLSSAGVVPEVVMKIYTSALRGDWETSKKTQFKLLDLFSLMVNAPNFPEGFRAGYQVRGFETGSARFPLSSEERDLMDEIRGRIGCILAECGFPEAAVHCKLPKPNRQLADVDIEAIVSRVMSNL